MNEINILISGLACNDIYTISKGLLIMILNNLYIPFIFFIILYTTWYKILSDKTETIKNISIIIVCIYSSIQVRECFILYENGNLYVMLLCIIMFDILILNMISINIIKIVYSTLKLKSVVSESKELGAGSWNLKN